MTKHDLSSLRDAINDCRDAQEKELLQQQLAEYHQKLEERQFWDDENWELWWVNRV